MAQGASVLVVEADAPTRVGLCEALVAAELATANAGSAAEAMDSLAGEPPSLVLIGLGSSETDGLGVLRAIRARPSLHDLPVVIVNARTTEEVTQALASGADDCIQKPWRAAELIARIRSQLRLRQYMEALERRERDAQVVLELTQALSSSLDFRDILFTVVRRIAEVAQVERCSIVLVRDEGDVGFVVAASDDEHLRDLPIALDQYPEIREVMASGEPLVIRDTSTHRLLDVVRKGLPPQGFTSLGLIPIIFEGKPMGVLFLRSRHVVAFGERELSVYRTIASATAIALRNARILQTLRDEKIGRAHV